jgi:hypothetical protein
VRLDVVALVGVLVGLVALVEFAIVRHSGFSFRGVDAYDPLDGPRWRNLPIKSVKTQSAMLPL